jgi:hypothetical protein
MAIPPDITEVTWQGAHCTVRLRRLTQGVVLLVIAGTDTGEHGSAPFEALESDVAGGRFHLFVDARDTRGVTVEVSSEWRRWLSDHRDALRAVHMLTGSRYVQVTAAFVRSFAELGGLMHIHADAAPFEAELRKLVPAFSG